MSRKRSGMEINMKESGTPKKGMLTSLEQMREEGVNFFVDGEEVTLAEAMKRTVQEDFTYMADYVLDDKGKVEQVRFDKVNLN